MQHKFAIISLFVSSLLVLTGCEKDVDLTNIDTRAELEMGLALPVGELSATLGDFIGTDMIYGLYTDENGAFCFQSEFSIPTKQFYNLDLSQYMSNCDELLSMTVQDKLGGLPVVTGDGKRQVTLEFPFQLSMDGINEDGASERLDSMWITSASFLTNLSISSFNLDWNEIDQVALVLSDQFTREAGDTILVPISGHNYNQDIPIVVDNFCLNLLKDRSDLSAGNMTTVDMKIVFSFTVRNGHTIDLSPASSFICALKIQSLDFNTVWGYFEAGNQMRDADTIGLADLMGPAWDMLKNFHLRFAEPEITLTLTHKVAAPLACHLYELRAYNSEEKQSAYATWNGQTEHLFPLENVLDPIHSARTDSVTNTARFSYKEDEGHIDNLFDVNPDMLIYGFGLTTDKARLAQYPQFRLTDDMGVAAKAGINVPFVFKENSSIRIDTLLPDIDISAISLDSLCADIDVIDSVKTSDLKLYIGVQNSLPFALKVSLHFLDEVGNEVPMDFGCGDTLLINGPSKEQIVDKKVIEPAQTNVCIRLSKNEWKAFAKVKQIRLVAELSENQATAQLDVHQKLAIRLGLGAKAGVVLDFNSLFNNSKK